MVKRRGVKGRPRIIIDWDEVDKLLIAGCAGTEIAGYIGAHPDTLYERCEKEKDSLFSDYAQQKRSHGNTLIRLAQFDEAVRKRDRGMLVWLGKNRLAQQDKSEVAHKGAVPIEIVNYGKGKIEPWKEKEKEVKK